MNEKIPPIVSSEDEKNVARQERIALAMELIASGETIPFPGINQESLDTIRQEQEEYPGYTTPIDELYARFNEEGMKLVMSKSGLDILILPAGSDNIEEDFLLLRNLFTEGEIDERLLALIPSS
jgi:hypothetical protein